VRIAIDARELGGKPTGVGRYLGEILAAWNLMPGAAAHEFVLCAPEALALERRAPGLGTGEPGSVARDSESRASHPHARVPSPESPVPGPQAARYGSLRLEMRTASGHGTAWEQLTLPRLVAGADVLFAPGYSGPLRGDVPMVVTVHDVSFAAHPEWFGWREGLRRRMITRRSAQRAARVITVSDFSKREIVRHLHTPADKVEVIYSGTTSLRAGMTTGDRPSEPPAGGPAGGHREPLVLYVGSLFNRRHIPELIEGFDRLAGRHPDARLDIVGDNRTRPHVDVDAIVAASAARDRIRARSFVADEEVASLYGRASAFAFLSDYEGFAMTPLEALGAGIPVVLLDTEVAREIYGPAALYVPRPEPALIAQALERLLFDQAERARQLDAARTQLARYSWHECAQRTLQVLLACART
jgi:glycosyltransferase involved in cell wall biosynthesis